MKWIFVLILSIGVLGCSPYESSRQETKNTFESEKEPDTVPETDRPSYLEKKLLENLYVKASVTYPTEESYATYKAVYKKTDREAVTEEMAMELFWEQGQGEVIMEDDSGVMCKLTIADQTAGSGIITWGTNSYHWSQDKTAAQAYDLIQTERNKLYNYRESFEGIDTDKELQGYSREDALAKVKTVASELSIDLVEQPKVFAALSADDLKLLCQDEESRWNNVYQVVWTQRGEEPYEISDIDECYYILWEHSFEGYPVAYDNLDANVRGDFFEPFELGGFLFAVLDKNGDIIYWKSSAEREMVEVQQVKELMITVDDVLNIIQDRYKNQILESKMTVKEIRFCYMPKTIEVEDGIGSEWEMYPGYEVFIESDAMAIMSEVIRVNAITGEVLIY